jgi:hypothetical protein
LCPDRLSPRRAVRGGSGMYRSAPDARRLVALDGQGDGDVDLTFAVTPLTLKCILPCRIVF